MKQLSFLALGLLVAACSSNKPDPEPDPRSQPRTAMGPDGRPRVAFDSARNNRVTENARPDVPARAGLLIVANQKGASASVIDASTMLTIATLPVGAGPHEAVVSPDGRWGVVSIYGEQATPGNKLAVIDLAAPTLAVTRTIDLGQYTRPHGVLFYQDGRKLAVTSETTQRLVLVDFASGKVDTALSTDAMGSHMVVARRDGKRAWTANRGSGNITELDLETRRTVRQLPGAPDNEGIAATPGGILLWIGSGAAKSVTIIDTEKSVTTGTLTGFGGPYRIGISRTGRIAVVCDRTNNKLLLYEVGPSPHSPIAEIDLAKEKEVAQIVGSGAAPGGITFDPIADIAYVTLNGSNQVVALNLDTHKVVGVGAVGTAPDGIAYSPYVRR